MGWFVVFSVPYLILLHFLLLFNFPSYSFSLCNPHDLSALLLFNNSFIAENILVDYDYGCPTNVSSKTVSWNKNTDCCEWDGVTCDTMSGHVIGLDLSCSILQGEFHPNTTLFHLTHLQQLNLAHNFFFGSLLYSGIGDLPNLTHLNLSDSGFDGDIPSSLSHLSRLVSLDLSYNNMRLDPSTWNRLILNASDISEIFLDYTNMSSINKSSLSLLLNLSSSLASLRLPFTGLQGNLPSDILCLPNLEELSFAGNGNLTGQLPMSNWTTPLRYLDLSRTSSSGGIPDSVGNLKSLNILSLSNCKFDGSIPSSLWNLTQLTSLSLWSNNFTGEIPPIMVSNLKHLIFLDLSFNHLEGQIPPSLFNSTQLFILLLSNNKLVGPIPSKINKHLKLQYLDLSFNLLNGTIPSWCFSLPSVRYLYLDDNQLTGSISEISTYSLYRLDFSNNKLQGNFPPSGLMVFSVSNNNLSGNISSTICNVSSLYILNLSHNNLSGMIPQCLGHFPSLLVLDLQRNNLHGEMPRNFLEGNDLETIKLNGNRLEGQLPQSLVNCKKLQVLDLGNNNIVDIFPTWLETLPELQVLVLRSNKFHSVINCSSTKNPFLKLRIFDVSANHFSGPLPASCIKNFQGMMSVNDSQTGSKYMTDHGFYYNDSVVVIMKGEYRELVRILTSFTTVDLSKNMFEGVIPTAIGELSALIGLNLSHNEITGTIPQSFGNLTSLEWLDLSGNQLTGEIPMDLIKLNFLSVLNLSQNQLEGMIPEGGQFSTFENVSYEGNPKLCGFPLLKSCNKDDEQPPQLTSHHEEESGFGWKSVVVGYASGVVFGMGLGYSVFFTGKPQWLARLLGAIPKTRVRRTSIQAHANH